ncbi:hypothetical protein D3C78_1777770 [compost metagenome]
MRCTPSGTRVLVTGSVLLMLVRSSLNSEAVVDTLPSSRSHLTPISWLVVFSGAICALLAATEKASPDGW